MTLLRRLAAAVLIATVAVPASAQSVADRLNDYPTVARADYIFGCMATNGQSRTALEKCACSIDLIASILPYEEYVEAETVLSLRQVGGERMSFFRSSAMSNVIVSAVRRAQAEAEIICF